LRVELAMERQAGAECGLVVGLEILPERAEVDMERLIAGEEVRLDELTREVVAEAAARVAAQSRGRGGEIELLGAAEQIAVAPGDFGDAAEIGRIGGGQSD